LRQQVEVAISKTAKEHSKEFEVQILRLGVGEGIHTSMSCSNVAMGDIRRGKA
jgi:hypothetical protein